MKSRLADSTSWLASLAGYFSWFSSKDGYNVGLFRDIVVVCADGSPYQSASACLFGVDLFYSWVGGNSPQWFSLCMLKREPWEIVEYWFYINGFSRTRELSWHPIELIWFDNPVLALFSCLHMRPVSYFSLLTKLWHWCRVQKFSENFYIAFNINFSILHVATFRRSTTLTVWCLAVFHVIFLKQMKKCYRTSGFLHARPSSHSQRASATANEQNSFLTDKSYIHGEGTINRFCPTVLSGFETVIRSKLRPLVQKGMDEWTLEIKWPWWTPRIPWLHS